MKLYFFQLHSYSTFCFVRFVSHYFNKLEINKTLISYFSAHLTSPNIGKCFPTYFSLHY